MSLGARVLCGIFLLCILTLVNGHERFWKIIPNGDKVTDPCGDGIWKRVGHTFNDKGNNSLNPFGVDLEKIMDKLKADNDTTTQPWSLLCSMDSDEDGKTNGEELGDKLCKWKEGEVIDTTGLSITHPGVKDEGGSKPNQVKKNKNCKVKAV